MHSMPGFHLCRSEVDPQQIPPIGGTDSRDSSSFKQFIRGNRPAYLSEDGVNDGPQLPPVSLLQPHLVWVSHWGGQAQGLGLWLRGPLHTC